MIQAPQPPTFPATELNAILLPVALVVAVLSYIRRRKEIGGWLMYFYYWIAAVLVVYLKDALGNYRVFLPSSRMDPAKHLALIVAVYPRLLALAAVVVIATAVLNRRDWILIERLRFMLGVTVAIAATSVVLDAIYFPGALFPNVTRCVMLSVWLLYFYFSKRVHHVFQTKDWDKFGTDQVLAGPRF
jgi:hypothetical protein